MNAYGTGQVNNAHEHECGDHAQHEQRSGGIAGFGALEAGHAVGDRLDPGQRRAARGESPQDEEGAGQTGQPLIPPALRDDLVRRALGPAEGPGGLLDETDDGENTDGRHVEIGRDGESTARLPRAAQVEHCQDGGDADGDLNLVVLRPGHGRRQIGSARGHGHGDGQDIIAQQRGGDEQARMRSQVGRDDLVVAASGGVGVHGLPIRGDHHHEHADDRQRDPR